MTAPNNANLSLYSAPVQDAFTAAPLPGLVFEVLDSDGALAVIYSVDDAGNETILANSQATTNQNAELTFYAVPGFYQLRLHGETATRPIAVYRTQASDPNEGIVQVMSDATLAGFGTAGNLLRLAPQIVGNINNAIASVSLSADQTQLLITKTSGGDPATITLPEGGGGGERPSEKPSDHLLSEIIAAFTEIAAGVTESALPASNPPTLRIRNATDYNADKTAIYSQPALGLPHEVTGALRDTYAVIVDVAQGDTNIYRLIVELSGSDHIRAEHYDTDLDFNTTSDRPRTYHLGTAADSFTLIQLRRGERIRLVRLTRNVNLQLATNVLLPDASVTPAKLAQTTLDAIKTLIRMDYANNPANYPIPALVALQAEVDALEAATIHTGANLAGDGTVDAPLQLTDATVAKIDADAVNSLTLVGDVLQIGFKNAANATLTLPDGGGSGGYTLPAPLDKLAHILTITTHPEAKRITITPNATLDPVRFNWLVSAYWSEDRRTFGNGNAYPEDKPVTIGRASPVNTAYFYADGANTYLDGNESLAVNTPVNITNEIGTGKTTLANTNRLIISFDFTLNRITNGNWLKIGNTPALLETFIGGLGNANLMAKIGRGDGGTTQSTSPSFLSFEGNNHFTTQVDTNTTGEALFNLPADAANGQQVFFRARLQFIAGADEGYATTSTGAQDNYLFTVADIEADSAFMRHTFNWSYTDHNGAQQARDEQVTFMYTQADRQIRARLIIGALHTQVAITIDAFVNVTEQITVPESYAELPLANSDQNAVAATVRRKNTAFIVLQKLNVNDTSTDPQMQILPFFNGAAGRAGQLYRTASQCGLHSLEAAANNAITIGNYAGIVSRIAIIEQSDDHITTAQAQYMAALQLAYFGIERLNHEADTYDFAAQMQGRDANGRLVRLNGWTEYPVIPTGERYDFFLALDEIEGFASWNELLIIGTDDASHFSLNPIPTGDDIIYATGSNGGNGEILDGHLWSGNFSIQKVFYR